MLISHVDSEGGYPHGIRTYTVQCERCQHQFDQRCSIDGGPSPAWRPYTNELCPGCGKSPTLSLRELHPDMPDGLSVVEAWKFCFDAAIKKHLFALDPLRNEHSGDPNVTTPQPPDQQDHEGQRLFEG